MQYRRFGKLDFMASALGFGCMRLPKNSEDPKDINEPEAIRLIRRAVEGGINYFDTAYGYHGGRSEVVLGRALRDGYREKVRIATKLPTWLVKSPADFDRLPDEQLRRLDVDFIDFYLLHALDGERWDRLVEMGVFSALDRYRRSGRIGSIGFSFHDELPAFKRIVDAWDWDFCQIQLNLMDEDHQAGLEGLRYAASKGLPVVIMEPLRGGALAKEPPEEVKRIWDRAPVSRTNVQWALRWVFNHPEATVVLSGMSTMEQLEDNLKTADDALPGSLTPEELEIFRAVKAAYLSRSSVACTGCRYCMPCPWGVDIPGIFALFNEAAMYDAPESARAKYAWIDREGRAESCRECGACERACPQGLPIRELLKKAGKALA